jgi:hypothetical protein
MIADQRIEDHVVEQPQHLRRTGPRDTAYQIEALRQSGPPSFWYFISGTTPSAWQKSS